MNEQFELVNTGFYLSNSKLTTYIECSQKYKFNYLMKLDGPKSSLSREYGNGIHETSQKLHTYIYENRQEPHIDDVLNWWHQIWKEITALSPLTEIKPEERNDLLSLGVESLSNYYQQHTNKQLFGVPIMVESKFRVPLIDLETGELITYEVVDPITGEISLGTWDLLGIIDLLVEYNNMIYVIDHKTSNKKYTQYRLDNDLQLTLYYYAITYLLQTGAISNFRSLNAAVAFNVFLKVKGIRKGEQRVQLLKGDRDMSHVKRLMFAIRSMIEGVNKNVYVPNYNHQYCSYCDFKDACKDYGVLTEDAFNAKHKRRMEVIRVSEDAQEDSLFGD